MFVDIYLPYKGTFMDVPYGALFTFTGPSWPAPLCKRIDKYTFLKLDDNCLYQVPLVSEDAPVKYNSNTPVVFNKRSTNG